MHIKGTSDASFAWYMSVALLALLLYIINPFLTIFLANCTPKTSKNGENAHSGPGW